MAPKQLLWQLAEQDGRTVLKVSNPSVYHVSIAELTLAAGAINEQPFDTTMVAPGQTKTFPLKKLSSSSPVTLKFLSINDYGAQEPYSAILSRTAVSAETAL